MLIKELLEAITEDYNLEKGAELYKKNKIIYYEAKKELSNVYSVEARINDYGEIKNVSLFLNFEKEYLSNFNCSCYSHFICSHIVATVLKFSDETKEIKNKKIKNKFLKYRYNIKGNKVEVDYEIEIKNWIKGYGELKSNIEKYLENMSYNERAILYEIKKNRNYKITYKIAEILKKLNIELKLELEKYLIYKEEDKIEIKKIYDKVRNKNIVKVEDKDIIKFKGKEITPKIIFEDLMKIYIKGNVKFSEELKKYVLYEEEVKYILNFKMHKKRVLLYPEIIIDNKKYKNEEILKIDATYHRISEYEYRRINIDEYKEYIGFLKNKNLKFTGKLFICENRFFKENYNKINKNWVVNGINKIKLEKEVKLNFNDKNTSLKIKYKIKNRDLENEELLNIKKYNFDVQNDKIYYVQPNGENIENYEFSGTKEELLCNVEKLKDKFKLDTGKIFFKDIKLNNRLKSLLRDYQKDGVKWLKFLDEFKFSGILADDMGLGKTIQSIAMIDELSNNEMILIVAPKSLIYNWKEEIEKFLPSINDKVVIYDGGIGKRKKIFEEIKKSSVILTSYSILRKDFEKFEEFEFRYMILDEAQHIKNRNTVIYKAISKIKSHTKLALTGTPIENSIKELWTIFEFLMPGYLGRYEQYNTKEGMEYLKYKLAPFILRREKVDVLKELPEKIEQIVKVEFSDKQRDYYEHILENMRNKVYDSIEEKGFSKSYFTILSAITYLREICNHPKLIEGGKDIPSGKFELLKELIDEAIEGNHKILIFSQFVKMLEIVKSHLEHKKIKFEILTGQTKERGETVKRFNTDETIKIFLISLKAGGVGLNLTSADTVIHIDPWWNPMTENQATDRVYRIGQTRNVNVYKLIVKKSIEEKILKIQNRKKELFDTIISGNKEATGRLTIEDLKDILE
ncbi:DEAD/DEAH box helicase [Haliovirga abyssi]|uniref:ATP-dependent helicase n=1 Tax=Haliovirga abyssi TaxID=2996794 RepID=A0AAU9D2Q2_9FUSO|nr:DEAD/DEAH box helicase [Haliovirga abyssi]BDU50261.1 hypothetical protein HLVA_08300 [Haliovirga abyssi]